MAVQARDLDDDASLVLAVQAGDSEAYAELFRRHHGAVRRVCARRLGDLVEADEVAQAAFVRAFERIDRCGGERRFGAWVQVIAHRLCIDAVRARTRTSPDDEPLKGDAAVTGRGLVSGRNLPTSPEESLLSRERVADVHKALEALPERQRAVVVARHLDGQRPGEIAASLGLSIGAVDSLLLRARRRLLTSYQAVASEQGAAAVGTGVAGSALTGGAVAGPGRIVRAFHALSHTLGDLSVRLGGGPAGVQPGGPSPWRAAVAAVAATGAITVPLFAASSPAVAPAAAPAVRVPAAPLPTVTTAAPPVTLPSAPLATPALPSATITAATIPAAPPLARPPSSSCRRRHRRRCR